MLTSPQSDDSLKPSLNSVHPLGNFGMLYCFCFQSVVDSERRCEVALPVELKMLKPEVKNTACLNTVYYVSVKVDIACGVVAK